ncbi:MAG: Ig-like domain repeat protein [Planctomycetota bacterium]|nr:Ig-like domain repeat protein [Planctomycetota bacterium]
MAAAVGGAVGVSVAVGVGLAENTIANIIDARITNADQGVKAATGGISIAADSRSTIATTAWAAAVSLAGGGAVGVSGAGAGIGVENRVTNTVLAHADASKLDIGLATQSLTILATEASSLSAVGVAAALSAAAGGGAGVAIGVGGGTARNVIANTVKASTSAAVVNYALAPTITGSGSITIRATANETAKLQLVGAAGAVAVGFAAVAGAAAVAITENTLANNVSATVTGGVIRAPGAITIDAQSTGTLTANAFAAAASVAAGIGGALAAGGATATNTVTNTVLADTLGTPTIVAGGNVTISAANTATFNASVTAVAVAGGLIGGSIGVSTIANTDSSAVTARVSTGTVTSTSGGVSIAATATDTTGTMLGVATAVTVGIGGAGAGTDVRSDFSPTLLSTIASGATVAARAGTVSITSTLTSLAKAETYGAAGGLVAIGTASGSATANGRIDALANGTITAGSIAVNSHATTTADFSGTGLAGGLIAQAVGTATATASPSVNALVGSAATLTATGLVVIYATATPSAIAKSTGVAVAAGALGASIATSTASPSVNAGIGGDLDGNRQISWNNSAAGRAPVTLPVPTLSNPGIGTLAVGAAIARPSSGANSSATASAGAGGLVGVAGATANAFTGGNASARVGDNIKLPTGNVSLTAASETSQQANGLGRALGLVGVGGVSSIASSGVTTVARLGTGVTRGTGTKNDTTRVGALSIRALGDNTNTATTVSSSGGLIAGSCADATTGDTSTSTAAIDASARLYADSIDVLADQRTTYAPTADASSASLAGASGSTTSNVSSTSAITSIGTNALIDTAGKAQFQARNRYDQSLRAGAFNAQGGAAGVASAAAGSASSVLVGRSEVTIGDGAKIRSWGLVADSSAFAVVMSASSVVSTDNVAIMNSQGLAAGTGVQSSVSVNLTDIVTIGRNVEVTADLLDVSIGTSAISNVKTAAETTTIGGVSLAFATTTTAVTAAQTVTVMPGAQIFAMGNVWLTPGKDVANNETLTALAATASAQAHTKGLAGVPTAKATATVTSNTTLDIGAGATIRTGGDVMIGGYPGTPAPFADGTATGDQIGGLFTTVEKDSTVSAQSSTRVIQNGTIEAGIYHTLNILIPGARNVAAQPTRALATTDSRTIVDDPATSTLETFVSPASSAVKLFSKSLVVNADGDTIPTNDLPFRPFVATFTDGFHAPTAIDGYGFTDPIVKDIFKSGVTSDTVVAIQLEKLTARGGQVIVNATSLEGSGRITANGGPSITVTNESANYLILSDVSIPNRTYGEIVFTSTAQEAQKPAGLVLDRPRRNTDPQITVINSFSGTVGGQYGPAIIVVPGAAATPGDTGRGIENLAGGVILNNKMGSIAQAAVVYAASFSAFAQNGVYSVSITGAGTYFAGSNPISDWYRAMTLPGRDGYGQFDASVAADYLANIFARQSNQPGITHSGALNTFFNTRPWVGSQSGVYRNNPGSPTISAHPGNASYTSPFTFAGILKLKGTNYYYDNWDANAKMLIQGNNPDAWNNIPWYDLTLRRSFAEIAGTRNSPTPPSNTILPTPATTIEDKAKLGISAGKIAITAFWVNINNSLESGKAVELNLSTNQADLDGLTQLAHDLAARGIVLAASSSVSRVPNVITAIRALPSSVTAAVKNDLISRVARYQYLGYFNGTQTARIPLASVDALRAPAATYATEVVGNPASAGTTVAYPANVTPPLFNERIATVTFNLATQKIDVGDVNAIPGGGFVYLNGRIINTGPDLGGMIKSVGGAGKVTIANPTTYAMSVGSIRTSPPGVSTVPTSIVAIIDKNLHPTRQQSVYTYTPGVGVRTYVGQSAVSYQDIVATVTPTVSAGTQVAYTPEPGQRWEWTMQAQITREPGDPNNGSLTSRSSEGGRYAEGPQKKLQVSPNWTWDTSVTSDITAPFSYQQRTGSYATTPFGKVIMGSTETGDFQQTISGQFDKILVYQWMDRPDDTRGFTGASWDAALTRQNYYTWNHHEALFPTRGTITVTSSVKASQRFGISFATSEGFVNVSSTGTLTMGQIVSPLGNTTISLPSSTTLVPSTDPLRPFAIESSALSITAAGSAIGSAAVPLEVNLPDGVPLTVTAGVGGVFVNAIGVVTFGNVTAGSGVSGAYGPVSITASQGLRSAPNTWIVGRTITLSSDNGSIGTPSSAVRVSPRGTVIGADSRTVSAPSVKASAAGDVVLTTDGDLWVDSISSLGGNVVVNAPNGKVLNLKNSTSADALGQALVEQAWSRLQLTGAGAEQRLAKTVTNYEEQVGTQFQAYRQLLRHGSVSGGVYTLATDKLDSYRLRAKLALGLPSAATDAQVQAYARGLYADLLVFFDRNSSTAYWAAKAVGQDAAAEAAVATPDRSWMARSEFTGGSGSLAWTATADQRTALTRNGAWTQAELRGGVNFSALAGSAVVGIGIPPSISGRNVTINDATVVPQAASGIGKKIADVWITFDQLQGKNGASLSDDDRAALLTANAPGDIELWGTQSIAPVTTGGWAFSGRTTVTVASVANLVAGMPVSGTGIQGGTRIQSIAINPWTGIKTLTLTRPVTQALSGASLSFARTADVQIRFVDGQPAVPLGVTPTRLKLPQTAPLFVNALGAVSVNAVGSIYLQGTGDSLTIGTISATSPASVVDITAPGSILAGSSSPAIQTAGNLLLLAGNGSIGTAQKPVTLTVGGTLLSATAGGDAYLWSTGNLLYGQVYAGGTASVAANGSIDYSPEASGVISADVVALSAGTTIGASAPVSVILGDGGMFSGRSTGAMRIVGIARDDVFQTGSVTSTAGGIDLVTTGDAALGSLTANQGLVKVTAAGAIVPAATGTNIRALSADLRAQTGIGTFATDGTPTGFVRGIVIGTTTAATATGAIALQQDSGDLRVGGIVSPGNLFLTAAGGSIVSAVGGASNVIASGNLFLAAAGSIGLREQDLVVDLAAGAALSATAGTGIQLTESSGNLTVSTATTFGGVRLTVPAGSLSLPAGATLAALGPVLLQVRGDVALAPTSTATAGNWFAIVGNYGKTGSGPDSLVSTTKSDGTSVIAAPYTSIGRFAPTGQGAATAADPGYSDAGKTTLATIGKAAGPLAGPIASDGRGNVFFFDPATNALKELDWTGSIRTLVSSGLNGALGLAVDRSGNVFIADRNTLPVVVADSSFENPAVRFSYGASFQYAPTGSPWTFTAATGTNGSGLTGNGTSFTNWNPNAPAGSQVAFLQGTGRISQSLTLEAGSYTLSLSTAQRLGSAANTQSIGVFVNGVSVATLRPANQNYSPLTTPTFTVAKGTHTVELRGLATTDQMAFIDSVAITSAQSPAIKQWNAITGALSTIVTTTTDPTGVAVDTSGNVFFSEGTDVKRWAAATGTVSTLFTGTAPKGLATDASGNLYAVDAGAGTVTKWTASTAVVSTIGAFSGLWAAHGIAVDTAGDIYVADTGNRRIQKWDGATSSVTTLVSSGLSNTTSLTLDTQGNLFTINSGASSSTVDAFQPWADVPTALIGQLSAAGTDTLPAVIPASQPLYGAFVPTSNQPWLRVTSTTDGAVRYAFDAAPSAAARTGQLTILGRQVTISQAAGLSASTITASPTISYGQSGAVTVRVTSTYAEPTGSVDLVVDGSMTFSGTLVAGSANTTNGVTTYAATATIAVPGLTAGDHALVANYSSQATFAGSTALGSIHVDKATAVATIASSKASSTYGEAVTFTATVPAVGGGANPTGTIVIQDGGTTIATGTLTGGSYTFTSSALLGGSHSLTAVYAGDSNHLAATSPAITQTVAKKTAVPALVRSAGVTPSTYGSNVTFTATLTPAVVGVPVTGTVQFYDGATPIGAPQTLSNSTAALTIPSLAGGSHTITALYAGDGVSYESATSVGIAHAVTKVTSTPLVSDAPNPSTYGATVTFTATLPAVGGGARPTGTVQFYLGTTVLVAFGTPQTLVNGTASVTSAALPVGNSSITAAYLGDDPNYVARTSAAVLQVVNKATATPSVIGTPNPTTFGDSVTLTATILPAGAGSMPTGTIQFLDNGVPLGGLVALVNGTATLATTALTTGGHAITARYSGDANYLVTTSASFTQTVNRITTTATLATSAASTVHGGSVSFTARLPAAATGTVTFFDDTVAGNRVALSGAVNLTVAAGATTGTATFTTTALTAGVRSIVAVYSGNTNYTPSTSAAVTQTIAKATPTTTVATPTAAIYGSAATLTATVARVTGGAMPTGLVTFSAGATTLGTATLDAAGTARFSTTALAVGSYTPITAAYAGDTNYLSVTSATSPAITLTVNKATPVPTIARTAGSASSTYGSSITLTATVPAVPGAAVPTGTVQFYDGATLIGTAQTLSNGTASISTSALSVSSHTAIKATYLPGADTNYLTASSALLAAVTVAKGTLIPTLASSTVSGTVTFTITMTPATGCAFPKGTITLRDLSSAAASFGTATLNATTGVATFSIAATTFSALGAHPITATYTPAVAVGLTAGEPNYLTATSAQLLQATVAPTGTAASTVSVTSSTAASVAFGTSVTFTATITVASGVAAPTGGVVEFWDGDNYLGRGTITLVGGAYKATFATTALARGAHAIRARFIGSASHAVSNSSTLTQTIS